MLATVPGLTLLFAIMIFGRAVDSNPDLQRRQVGTPTGGTSGGQPTGGNTGNSNQNTSNNQNTSIPSGNTNSPTASPTQGSATPSATESPTQNQPTQNQPTQNQPTNNQPTSNPGPTQAPTQQAPSTAGPSTIASSTNAPPPSTIISNGQTSVVSSDSASSIPSGSASSITSGSRSSSGGLAPGLGTTTENGQLVFRTTNAQGSTITYSGSAASSAITADVTSTSALVGSTTRPVTSVLVITTDGRAVTSTSIGSAVDVSTTGFAISTGKPQLSGSNSDGSSGLSDSSKKVIGGVVGGIGGAIVLGALALVAWRIWGRKKGADDDTLVPSPYQSGGGLVIEKPGSQNGSTTYSNGLDRYQGGRQGNVNTASNF